MAKTSFNTVNNMIQSKYPEYSLKKEKDCVYISGPDTRTWNGTVIYVSRDVNKPNHSIYKPRISEQTPEQWLQHVENAIRNRGTCTY